MKKPNSTPSSSLRIMSWGLVVIFFIAHYFIKPSTVPWYVGTLVLAILLAAVWMFRTARLSEQPRRDE